MLKLMKIALFASALAAASLPAQAQLSSHELSVLEARLLAHNLTYEKYCGPLGPQSHWDQKRLSELPTPLSEAEITEVIRDAITNWNEMGQKYCALLHDGMAK
jgi:hypothetical protein